MKKLFLAVPLLAAGVLALGASPTLAATYSIIPSGTSAVSTTTSNGQVSVNITPTPNFCYGFKTGSTTSYICPSTYSLGYNFSYGYVTGKVSGVSGNVLALSSSNAGISTVVLTPATIYFSALAHGAVVSARAITAGSCVIVQGAATTNTATIVASSVTITSCPA
jgi:hypothetical protein